MAVPPPDPKPFPHKQPREGGNMGRLDSRGIFGSNNATRAIFADEAGQGANRPVATFRPTP